MQKTLTWISPHKTALVTALMTLAAVIVFGILGFVLGGIMRVPDANGMAGNMLAGVGGIILSGLIAPFFAYLFTFLYCTLLNLVLRLFGGIDLRLEDQA